MIDINQILSEAPSAIARHCEVENQHYAEMLRLHEDYKRLRAKKYLEMKADDKESQKDREYALDCDEELCKVKDLELQEEISYRAARQKKEKAENYMQSALELGRTKRAEIRGLSDVIPK